MVTAAPSGVTWKDSNANTLCVCSVCVYMLTCVRVCNRHQLVHNAGEVDQPINAFPRSSVLFCEAASSSPEEQYQVTGNSFFPDRQRLCT